MLYAFEMTSNGQLLALSSHFIIYIYIYIQYMQSSQPIIAHIHNMCTVLCRSVKNSCCKVGYGWNKIKPQSHKMAQIITFPCVDQESWPKTNSGNVDQRSADSFFSSSWLLTLARLYAIRRVDRIPNMWDTFACWTSDLVSHICCLRKIWLFPFEFKLKLPLVPTTIDLQVPILSFFSSKISILQRHSVTLGGSFSVITLVTSCDPSDSQGTSRISSCASSSHGMNHQVNPKPATCGHQASRPLFSSKLSEKNNSNGSISK